MRRRTQPEELALRNMARGCVSGQDDGGGDGYDPPQHGEVTGKPNRCPHGCRDYVATVNQVANLVATCLPKEGSLFFSQALANEFGSYQEKGSPLLMEAGSSAIGFVAKCPMECI
jgi:hypothetical protein